MRPLLAALALLLAGEARAEEAPALVATLQCDRAVEPGRVRCTVETRVSPGRTLRWADVVIVELPDLAQALKGRVGPADSIARDATSERWAFGVVAKKTGEGTATVRVRAVVCLADDGGAPRCAPVTALATTTVRVG